MHSPILFTGINTEQAHDIGFPSLEVTLLNNVKLSRICRHFGFAMATGGRKPVACSKMLIFSHLVNFGGNFPSSLLRWQNGLGTAWPGQEPEVKRPETVAPPGLAVIVTFFVTSYVLRFSYVENLWLADLFFFFFFFFFFFSTGSFSRSTMCMSGVLC